MFMQLEPHIKDIWEKSVILIHNWNVYKYQNIKTYKILKKCNELSLLKLKVHILLETGFALGKKN